MGLASSQARLLSITARLTSNEYESQQISNAKMRLATQSQEASEAYLSALSDTQYSFISYDSSGSQVQTPLTVATMYEYADGKNQYILTNSSGKVLLSNKDIQNYQNSPNLESFLEKYGVTRIYKTQRLEDVHHKIFVNDGESDSPYLYQYALQWRDKLESTQYQPKNSNGSYSSDKAIAQERYLSSLGEYTILVNRKNSGDDIPNEDIMAKQLIMERALQDFSELYSYDSAIERQVINENPELYKGYREYINALSEYNDELNELGISANNAYKYDDNTKAQWYTNLWYRLNGSSTDNTGANNYTSFNISDGIREAKDGKKIVADDASLLNSSVWISNALSKGIVNIEQATYSGEQLAVPDEQNPFSFNLYGISWSGKIYSTISDIIESNNDKKIAQAEAEYQRRTTEINAKDEKYQRKISLLDSEHNAIQTEYESVKSAMNKNIDRSFKAFQG